MYPPTLTLISGKEFTTCDPRAAREHVAAALQPHVMRLRPGEHSLDFHRRWDTFGSITFSSQRYGREVWIRTEPTEDAYLVLFTVAGRNRIEVKGAVLDATMGTVCVVNPRTRCQIHSSADFDHIVLRIDGNVLRRCVAEEFGLDGTSGMDFLPTAVDFSNRAPGLGSLAGFICSHLNAADAMHRPEVVRHLERSLFNLMLVELPHSLSGRMDDPPSRPAPAHVRKARDYLHAHAREPVLLTELAAQINVSTRALQLGFRRCYGMTPMQYLRECRLRLAREQLCTADGPAFSVYELALECGFSNPGRFARHYRNRFGEAPSVTLRHRMT